jgi:hypothetical protein
LAAKLGNKGLALGIKGLRLGRDELKHAWHALLDIGRAYKTGGIKGVSKEAAAKSIGFVKGKYNTLAGRYGKKAAVAMMVAWAGYNAPGAPPPGTPRRRPSCLGPRYVFSP